MPTYSDAISDNDFSSSQKQPTPQLKRPKRLKEFWESEPGDAGTEGWKDDPDHPTDAQLGSVANPNNARPQTRSQVPILDDSNVVITPDKVTSSSPNAKWTEYTNFVDAVTSEPSKNGSAFIARTAELQAQGCKIERLLTAAVGISAEGGEFMEIVKKIAFQGKPYDEANINHLRVELGDVLWYVAQACIALDVSLDDVIGQNIKKLSSRYPGGTFDEYFSENRRIDDI